MLKLVAHLGYQLIEGNQWKRYWCVLSDETIFLFNSHKESKESLAGSIALGPESRLEKLDGDERSGYKFHLSTKRSLNIFKASKSIERELWKAYVEGITLGKVSNTLDLLPGQIEDVRSLIQQFFLNRPRASTSQQTPGSAVSDLKDGFDTPNSSTSGSYLSNVDSSGYLVPTQKGAPTAHVVLKYKFYPDLSRIDIPSWFFSACTRDLSQQILTAGATYGNTLMRESTSGAKNLVISKRMESANGQDFTHYILESTPQGYKIDVENPHEPMQTLSEVMDFFVATSGNTTTRPMKCNDLRVLGIEKHVYNDYNTKIVRAYHDADSGEEIVDAEVSGSSWLPANRGPPDAIAPPLPHLSKKDVKHHNTVGPGERWNTRSVSVPNIHPQELYLAQASRLGQVSGKSSGPQNSHIMRTNFKAKQGSSLDKNSTSDETSSTTLPPVPHKKSSLQEAAPPLPPNHPPPLVKANSQTIFKNIPDDSSAKKTTPKHTQSMSSADKQVRKMSPRDQHSALHARDELEQIAARINKHKEADEGVPKSTEPVARSETVEEGIKSPTVATESFKKKLEDLLGNPCTPGQRPRIQNVATSPSDVYESIAHYQNANEIIQSARK